MSFSTFNRAFGISASLTPTGPLAKSDSNSKSPKKEHGKERPRTKSASIFAMSDKTRKKNINQKDQKEKFREKKISKT